jgi:DNA polymerase
MTTLSDRIEDYCFIDTETKALPHTKGTPDESVTDCGAYRYRRGARVVMIQHAIGASPVQVSAFPDFDITRKFLWAQGSIPDDLWEFHQRALAGEAWYAAWNMAFDRLMLCTVDGCMIRPDMTIDVMAQALASNMPPKLEGASRFIGRGGKQQDGKDLIKMFCGADGWHRGGKRMEGDGFLLDWVGDEGFTPETHPEDWRRFMSYGEQDIDELRAVFQAARPLPREEWREYWVSEKINDRGMRVDVDFCVRADMIAAANQRRLGKQLKELTGGKIDRATQRERIADWLFDHTPQAEARDALVKTWEVDEDAPPSEDDEQLLLPGKLSIAADRLERFIAYFEDLDEREGLTDLEYDLLQIAQARSFGASSTPAKFGKIVDMHDEGRLMGQYRFNGAQQTGRFSSIAVQIHNLIRACLTDREHPGRELDVIEFINQLALD